LGRFNDRHALERATLAIAADELAEAVGERGDYCIDRFAGVVMNGTASIVAGMLN